MEGWGGTLGHSEGRGVTLGQRDRTRRLDGRRDRVGHLDGGRGVTLGQMEGQGTTRTLGETGCDTRTDRKMGQDARTEGQGRMLRWRGRAGCLDGRRDGAGYSDTRAAVLKKKSNSDSKGRPDPTCAARSPEFQTRPSFSRPSRDPAANGPPCPPTRPASWGWPGVKGPAPPWGPAHPRPGPRKPAREQAATPGRPPA